MVRSILVIAGLAAGLWGVPQGVRPAVDPVVQQARALLQQGHAAAAAALLHGELERHPGEADLLDLAGVAEAQLGHHARAEKDLLAAIEAGPDLAGAYLNLGQLYQQEGAGKKALEVYTRLLRRQPDNPEAHYESAVLWLHAGQAQEALRHLRQLPADAREHSQVAAAVCSARAVLHDAQAEACVCHWLSLGDFSAQDATAALPFLHDAGARAAERMLLQALAERNAATPEQQIRLATLDGEMGDDRTARALLDRLAVSRPHPFPLLMQLAEIADRQQDFKGALGYLAHARDLEPQNAAVHFFFGMECVRLKLMEEAWRSLQKAVALAPENPFYNYALGAVILQRRNPDDAVRYFEKYHQLRPHDVHGAFALGAACFATQDYPRARRLLQPLTTLPATAAGAWYLLGRMDLAGGHDGPAETELRHALQTNPRMADAAAHLGLVLLRQHRDAEAAQALRQALGIDPENYVANYQLLLLYRKTHDSRAGQQATRLQELQKARISEQQEFYRVIRIDPGGGLAGDHRSGGQGSNAPRNHG